MIYRFRFITIALLLAHTVMGLSAPQVLDIEDFATEVLKYDIYFQQAIADEQMAHLKKTMASSLWRSAAEVGPYRTTNRALDFQRLKTIETNNLGVQWGFTQFSPWGTQFRISYDQILEKTEFTNSGPFPLRDGAVSFSLSQPLWKNYFGATWRLQASSADHYASAQTHNTLLKRREACARAGEVYIDAWTQRAKQTFVAEVTSLSKYMLQKGSAAFRRGQIGQLDYYGLQSDNLNLQALNTQAEQTLLESQIAMQRIAPTHLQAALKDPSLAFNELQKAAEKLTAPQPTAIGENFREALLAADERAEAEKASAHPDLDLKLTKTVANNHLDSLSYQESQINLSLNLVWKLNDPSVTTPTELARLEANKIEVLSNQYERNRNAHFLETLSNLRSLKGQIDLESQRAQILEKITSENSKRFFQGRIEFQDLLRIKEQWLDSQQKLLDKQKHYWKTLLTFAVQENVKLTFCRGD